MEDTDAPITGVLLKGDKDTYVLHQELSYNPETRVRVYTVTKTTELAAKEYNLNGLSRTARRSRCRDLRRFSKKRGVVDFVRLEGRKIAIYKHRPRASGAETGNGSAASNSRRGSTNRELHSATPPASPVNDDVPQLSTLGGIAVSTPVETRLSGPGPADQRQSSPGNASEAPRQPGGLADGSEQPQRRRRRRRPKPHRHDSSATVVQSPTAVHSVEEPSQGLGTTVVSGPAFSDGLHSATTLGPGQSTTTAYSGFRAEAVVQLSSYTAAATTGASDDAQQVVAGNKDQKHLMYGPALIPVGPPIMDDRVGAKVVPVIRAPILVGRIGLVGCLLCSVGLGPNPVPYPTETPSLLHEGLIEGVRDVVLEDHQGAITGIWFRRDGPDDTELSLTPNGASPTSDVPPNNERGRNMSV